MCQYNNRTKSFSLTNQWPFPVWLNWLFECAVPGREIFWRTLCSARRFGRWGTIHTSGCFHDCSQAELGKMCGHLYGWHRNNDRPKERSYCTEKVCQSKDYWRFFDWPGVSADMVNILNSISLFIQGGHKSILEVSNKITTFMKKTDLWKRSMHDGIIDMFPQLTEFLCTNNLTVATVREVITSHLTSLSKHCSWYFSDVNTFT